ncbi:ABC transporter permease [Parasutterella muris]|jgi:ABC-type dipeptide/oligopeptide/nickel transport systems, permease components|uniref:ABC transporter permease subunit n=1 Tax=Parasutterella muris TaxID=2565572 RepID=A0A6L6YH81_9BURK|nr:ABC transporter permease [Parasutterella muris]MVX56119.1 ABC transporter permease subunit [Parasutterella muris]
MLTFVLKRLLQAVIVMLVVTLIAFLLFQFIGDPVTQMLGQEATEADRIALRQSLGLDEPLWKQYGTFVVNALHGEFGTSLRQGAPVAQLLAEKMPATLELAFFSAFVATLIGIPLGVFVALHKDSMIAKWLMGLSLLGISLPTFFIGILLILVFSVWLGWLPSYGRGEIVAFGKWTTGLLTADGLKHIILPAATLAIFQIALVMRLVRSEMLETLRSDFIRFAHARGIPKSKIFYKHALKNTLLPVITITGLQLGGIIAFSIVTETVFQWPGMGLLFIQAVQFADIPVMAAYLCLISLIFVVINLIVDLLYFLVDPRLKAD